MRSPLGQLGGRLRGRRGSPPSTPKNVGTYLPPGGAIGFQMHYTPFGKEVTDDSQIGLYFYKDDEPPGLMMRNTVIVDNHDRAPAERRHATRKPPTSTSRRMRCSTRPSRTRTIAATPRTCDLHTPDGTKKLLLQPAALRLQLAARLHFAEPVKSRRARS